MLTSEGVIAELNVTIDDRGVVWMFVLLVILGSRGNEELVKWNEVDVVAGLPEGWLSVLTLEFSIDTVTTEPADGRLDVLEGVTSVV